MKEIDIADRVALGLLGDWQDHDDVVRVHIDGVAYLCHFRVDGDEHQRRAEHGLGAVTSTGLLHALWNVPEEGVLWQTLTSLDAATVDARHAEGLVETRRDCVFRAYRPPGRILLLATRRPGADAAIRNAMRLPPIFGRAAIWNYPDVGRAEKAIRLIELAKRSGLGLVEARDSREPAVLSPPADPIPGLPAVSRWYYAELAYSRWLHAHMAQASS